jgi:DNA-binding MarR family transcriptional regulator
VKTDRRIEGIFSIVAAVRKRGNHLIERELEKRDLEGIVPAHGPVFSALFEADGPVSLKRIVERTGRVKSTVTGMVRTLEKHGYVHRSPSERDGRSWNIGLTKKGEQVRQAFREISSTLLDRAWKDFSPSERQDLATLLEKLRDNLPPPREE